MDGSPALFLGIAALTFAIIFSGVPVAYGIGALAMAIAALVVGVQTLPLLGSVAFGDVNSYSLIAIPLFILTAEVLSQANLSDRAFEVVARRMRRIPANLAVASNLLSTIFAAIVGSSAGNTAIMARVALRPMMARSYDTGLACGVIVAGGALGVLIPPSTLMVLYGIVAEVSVGQLLIGGLLPGLLMSAMQCIYVVAFGMLRPERAGGQGAQAATAPARAELSGQAPTIGAELGALLPILLLLFFMTFAIYVGFATAAEIAAIGAAAAIGIVACYRRMTLRRLQSSLSRTVQTSAMILLIVVMAALLGRLLAFMDIGQVLVDGVRSLDLSPMQVVVGTCIVLLILGCFLDSAAIILVFGPLFHALMVSLGIDPLWWAVIFVITMEIGLLTPPFGINLFVLKSIEPTIPMATIIRGVLPFVAVQILALTVCLIFPQIITWLPRQMI